MSLFTAVVVTSTAATYTVSVVRENNITPFSDGGNTIQGIAISSHLASFFGFKDCGIPQPGSRVLCAGSGSNTCYIIGVIPQNNLSSGFIPGRVSAGVGCASNDDANRIGHKDKHPVIPNNRRPADVVDGEYVISNEFGVLLGLFQTLATLKASELAQVQCHLLDDLVRIVSHNFQHYTALGEYNIWHDGKSLMAEFGATHIPAESLGRPSVLSDAAGAPVFSETSSNTPDDKEDFYKITENERIKAIERFKVFLGRLGDFLHIFLVKPDDDEVRCLDPEKTPQKPDTGLFDLHLGTDGGVHIRSLKEVFIEKTNWIRVPLRYSAPEDQKGDDATGIDYDKKETFDWDTSHIYKENPLSYFLQIRDYLAYVNEKTSYQNFKKHKKDFYVNDDIAKEKSLSEITNVDESTELDLNEYKLRTAGIYLMPNGGITIRDAWNSAIVLEGGNVYIQPAKDLVLQPLRNFIAKVGGWTSIAGKEDIDISSTDKGFRLKTEKSQYFYSDKSGIVVESNSSTPTTGSPDPATKAITDIGGIVLKSKLGIYNYAETEILNYSKDRILFQAVKDFLIQGDELISIKSKNSQIMLQGKTIVADGKDSALFLSSAGLAAFAGDSGSVFGKKDEYIGVTYDKKSFVVDILKGALDLKTVSTQTNKDFDQIKEPIKYSIFQENKKFTDLKFRFLDSKDYYGLQKEIDAIPTTMAQQDAKLTELYNLTPWKEKDVNDTKPFPGKDDYDTFYLSAEVFKNLKKSQSGEKDSYSSATAKKTPATLKLSSLDEYKIQSYQ